MIKKIINVLLVIIWMIVIFSLSNQDSNQTVSTTNIIYRILGITSDSEFLFIFIRKLAHIFEYLILGFLICNMLNSFNVKKIYIITILICIIYACFDEFHQLFIQGRDGKIIDCFIDLIGSIFGISVYQIKQKILQKTTKKSKKVLY